MYVIVYNDEENDIILEIVYYQNDNGYVVDWIVLSKK